MKVLLYFSVYAVVTFSIFLTLLYLMTVVDPDLMQLPAKAAKMMQTNRGLVSVVNGDATLLPPENYLDFEEFMKKETSVRD